MQQKRKTPPKTGQGGRVGRTFSTLAFAGLLAVPAATGAQPAPTADGAVPALVPREQTPLYHLVSQFFPMMLHYKENHPGLYDERLLEIGIDPRSKASEAFGHALDTAKPILDRPSVDPSLMATEDRFLAFQESVLREKAEDLAEVYGGLLADLDASGVNPDRVRTYLDQTVRKQVSVWIDVTPGADPVDRLRADRNVQAVLPFEQWAEAAYRRHATGEPERNLNR